MNIFVLDRDPKRAARYHCDRHVVKMVLETAQLLSTAVWAELPQAAVRLTVEGLIYRPTHQGHPCAKWAYGCRPNFLWLARLGEALGEEYTYRYGREHQSAMVIHALRAAVESAEPESFLTWGGRVRRTPFAQAMPLQYRGANPVAAYRRYYVCDKAPFARWTRRREPHWFKTGLADQVTVAGS